MKQQLHRLGTGHTGDLVRYRPIHTLSRTLPFCQKNFLNPCGTNKFFSLLGRSSAQQGTAILCINLKKTKIVVFQKKTHRSTLENYDFMINNKRIETVNDYTYLGVNFSSNGSFIRHKEKLQEKAGRSIFAFRRYLDPSKLSINVCNKLFDALFLSILTYSSEVWGAYDKNENTTWEKDTIEKTHINFCKVFLGVNKRSPNEASRNELGRLPLKLQITQNIIKYWFHLKGLKINSIAGLCLEISNKMAEENKQCSKNRFHLTVEAW